MSYESLGAEIGRLVESKQEAYGDSFGKAGDVLRILYPDGIPPEKLDHALTVVRVIDKLFRVATAPDALGENPWKDIVGYGLLESARAPEPKTPERERRPCRLTPKELGYVCTSRCPDCRENFASCGCLDCLIRLETR